MVDTGISADDLRTQIAQVQACITDILTTGQSYTRPGITLTRANLRELREEKSGLIRDLTRMSGSGSSLLSDFSGGGVSGRESSEWGN